MECPKCHAAMEKITTDAGEVDRCSACKGLWFDMLEHEDQRAHAATLDIGDAAVGAEQNKVDHIHCPVCANTPLIRMVDPGQPHIWFESCTVCYGRFFDAGEFRDLAEHSLRDIYRRWRAMARD